MLIALCLLCIGQSAFAGSIIGWGAQVVDGNDVVAISAGYGHNLALKSDGSVAGWGSGLFGAATVPMGNEFVAIAAGQYHGLALKSDGSIVGWGDDRSGQGTPPDGNDFVAIAAGGQHSLALTINGSIVAWGSNGYGQAEPPEGSHFAVIAAGWGHSLALGQNHVKYSGGTGEPNDPYQIATVKDLMVLGDTPEDFDKHFILTADIDMDPRWDFVGETRNGTEDIWWILEGRDYPRLWWEASN